MEILLGIAGVILLIHIVNKLSKKKKTPKYKLEYTGPTYRPVQRRRPSQIYEVELPKEFILTDEFKKAFDLMENSNSHIFITGKAGTGKSTLLQYFRKQTRKNVVVLAPTGVAAVNVGGKTIHSFFKLPPRLIQKEDIRPTRNRELIKKIDTVLIDEISMVRSDLMDGVDLALRTNRSRFDLAFGGVQMIFIGDLYQLPPVVDSDMKEVFDMLYPTPYFFSSNVFKKTDLQYIELEHIHRQSDPEFISILNSFRDKKMDASKLALLNKRLIAVNSSGKDNYITLTTTNNGANFINETQLERLPGREHNYEADIFGQFDESSYPAEVCLKLKQGAQVMLIKNDPNGYWVNGTIGVVESLSNSSIRVSTKNGTYDIPREKWEKIEYRFDHEKQKIEAHVIGSFQQYPIKLAWAITIHKSQGKTFDNVIIDFERGAFAHGQAYVALSRCKTLEGIILKRPVSHSDIIFDERIYQFRERFRCQS